jgi:hypothetical protein
MNHFTLVNDIGYRDDLDDSFSAKILAGEFDLSDDPQSETDICLCSHGSDECYHGGRGG